MGKKNKKEKKVSIKKQRYMKFRKEKNTTVDLTMPELTPEEQKQKREDENRINKFLRFNKNAPPKDVVARRGKSKR